MSISAAISAGLASMRRQEARVEAAVGNIVRMGVTGGVLARSDKMEMVGSDHVRASPGAEASAALVGDRSAINDIIDLVVAKRGYQANVSSFAVLQDMARSSTRIAEERNKG